MIGHLNRPRTTLLYQAVTGLLLLCVMAASPVKAQDTLRIAAVVNEDAISVFDLQSRTMLVAILSGLPQNQQTVQRLAPQVLRLLIDEKLKLQEATRMGIDVSQSEIEAALENAHKIHKYAPGELVDLLEQTGIGMDALIGQIRSDIAWSRIVPRKYAQNITITDEDIDRALAQEQSRQNQPRYLLSELVLVVDSPASLPTVQEQAQQLIAEIRNGASFESLARSFSQSPSGSTGGALDWLRLDQLPQEISPIVQAMHPGQTSEPIPVPGALMIIKLRERRIQNTDKQSGGTVNLNQFHLIVPDDATDDVVQTYIATAREKTLNSTSCEELSEIGAETGSPLSGNLGNIETSRLPAEMLKIVKPLAVGTPSQPIRTRDAVIVLMVCERTNPDAGPEAGADEKKRQQIQRRIFDDRMAVYARQALRDLRRAAFIDVR